MCFSATASFALAATTAAIGVAVLRHVTQTRQLPLALVPMLFAAQQAVEGFLWLQLPPEGSGAHVEALTLAFLVFAEVLWPVYAPITVWLIEPDRRRRLVLGGIAIAGALLSANLLAELLGTPPVAAIQQHHIVYGSHVDPVSWQQVPYLLCICGSLLVSSHRTIRLFGLAVTVGFIVSVIAYFEAFVSVWCFFAAANSTLLYLHFRHEGVAVRRA